MYWKSSMKISCIFQRPLACKICTAPGNFVEFTKRLFTDLIHETGTCNAQVRLENQCWPMWCVPNKYVFRSLFFQTICEFSAYECFEKQATDYQFSAINFVFFASVWPIPCTKISPSLCPCFCVEPMKHFCVFSPSVLSSPASCGCGKEELLCTQKETH